MKKGLIIVILCLILLYPTTAENLYLLDYLEFEFNLSGEFTLIAEQENAQVRQVTTELKLIPERSFRQNLEDISYIGKATSEGITYTWDDQTLGVKPFGYSSIIKTNNLRLPVQMKVPFPTDYQNEAREYTLPSEKIDSDNPLVINKAAELANGEDDLFKVTFKLASWVEENVKYDLNTLTASATQPASWVLEHKQGVCDEMTSLFIAMARSLGIPARFVKGISYTTSNLFTEHWQPHGWAEVYFPNIGWISFDITFGEYGYIDVTHIKLREGIDPSEPDTKYKWIADDVTLKTQPLKLDVTVLTQGQPQADDIVLQQEIIANEVGFGSYNLVKGIVTNKAPYYIATTLHLGVPQEIEVEGRLKRTILLSPGETREAAWLIHVPESLEERFIYRFPVIIYSEKNTSKESSFIAEQYKPRYSQEEMAALITPEEEKSYSQNISLLCNYPKELDLHEAVNAECTIKNKGNANLQNILYCVDEDCDHHTLLINQKEVKTFPLDTDTIGWHKVIVRIEQDYLEKRTSIEYAVVDPPQLEISIDTPLIIHNEQAPITVTLKKTSFNTPRKITLHVTAPGIENSAELDKVQDEEIVLFHVDSSQFGMNNHLKIVATWQDSEGKVYTQRQEVFIAKESDAFLGKLILLAYELVNIFRS